MHLIGERRQQQAWQCYVADCLCMLAKAWYKELELERYSQIIAQSRQKPDHRTTREIYSDLISRLGGDANETV